MKYYKSQYIDSYDTDKMIKFLFFWGHTPKKNGEIGKNCLSQWWISPFEVDNVRYRTAEHWMMAEKARLFNDFRILSKIIECKTAAEAKKWGRKVSNFDIDIWNTHKYEIVKQGNYHKFSQNSSLRDFLLNTKSRVLVETSPVDSIWGIGMSQDDEDILNPSLWKGKNLLGFALMEVRDELLK